MVCFWDLTNRTEKSPVILWVMKDIDGGLHPAVDGQSVDEDEDDIVGYSLINLHTANTTTDPPIAFDLILKLGQRPAALSS